MGKTAIASKRPVNVAGGYACYNPEKFIDWHKWWVKQGYAPLPYYAELVQKRLTEGVK